MNRALLSLLFPFLLASCSSQKKGGASFSQAEANTLLWRISGNGISEASYLFGTIHMLCKDDAILSDSLKAAILKTEQVYFEVDMDNLFEMLGVMTKMKMRNDTTLADLLSASEYERVKTYFTDHGGLLPFSVIEKYKPFLAASTMMEGNMPCEENVAMEQVIMQMATRNKKKINGLESLSYQMSIFDSIPYKTQAKMLLQYIEDEEKGTDGKDEYGELLSAYKEQNLAKLESLTKEGDMGIANFEDLLLYNRNRNWVKKLNGLLKEKSMTIAVGAGHLPGENGLLNLLRQSGFRVEPVDNTIRTASNKKTI